MLQTRTLSDFAAPLPQGGTRPLSDFVGNVVLVVNVASKCGFTPQYEGLEALYEAYGSRGFVILGFPCNQFGHQEPGGAAETAATCESYGVSFPVFGKLDVNGPEAHPLFAWLAHAAPGLLGSEAIKWNFTKFLLDRRGQAVARFAPMTAPSAIAPRIEKLLLQQ